MAGCEERQSRIRSEAVRGLELTTLSELTREAMRVRRQRLWGGIREMEWEKKLEKGRQVRVNEAERRKEKRGRELSKFSSPIGLILFCSSPAKQRLSKSIAYEVFTVFFQRKNLSKVTIRIICCCLIPCKRKIYIILQNYLPKKIQSLTSC